MPRQGNHLATMRRGRLTIPISVRQAAHLPENGTFLVQRMGDGVLLIPEEKVTPAMQAMLNFRRTADDAGVSLQDLLDGLDDVREEVSREFYGAG